MRERDDTPQIRCGNCDKLLGKGTALDLAIKCPRCGHINHIKEGQRASQRQALWHHKDGATTRR
jgi:phage FluMu protein Com